MSTPHKSPVRRGGITAPLTRLKKLPFAIREKIFEWTENLSLAEARAKIKTELGIALGSDRALSQFRSWQFHQRRLENYNHLSDQFEEFYRKANPTASRDKIREAGIAFFMAEAMANNDAQSFLDFAHASMKEESGKTRANQTERKLSLEERRVQILERKAAQADAAAQIVKSDLSPEEAQQRIKAIFGMS